MNLSSMKDSILSRSQFSQSTMQYHPQSQSSSNTSLLFNNSVIHPNNSQQTSTSSQTLRIVTDRPFERPPNPTISQINHSSLLKDSLIMKKYSLSKQEKLSQIHTSKIHPHINTFAHNEGTYDNLTYQPVRRQNIPFIPQESSTKGSKSAYKFQMSQKQYFDSIENIPRAGFNPFHLVPDINPTQQDLVTAQVPIYTKLPSLYQSHMLDQSSLKKDKDTSALSSIAAANNEMSRKFSQTIDALNNTDIIESEVHQQNLESLEAMESNAQAIRETNYEEEEQPDIDQAKQQTEADDYKVVETTEEPSDSILLTLPQNITSSIQVVDSSQQQQQQQLSILGQTSLPRLEQSSIQSSKHFASEFDLQSLRQAKLTNILEIQTQAIAEFARNHPKNFSGKAELAQLAKCMILNASNSPTQLIAARPISLGRSVEDLLRVSKFEDRDYYSKVISNDKLLNTIKQKNQQKESMKEQSALAPPSVGVRQFGRISHGLIKPHDPTQTLKYVSQSIQNPKTNGVLSVKRQNIHRNVGSYNHLAHSVKSLKHEYLESVDHGYIRPVDSLKKRPSRFFMPNYMANKLDNESGIKTQG